MKKYIFMMLYFAILIMSITSCSSTEDIMTKPSNTSSEDSELQHLCHAIDSIQNEYYTFNFTRFNWDKWGRRGLNLVVDGFVSFALAETGPIVSLFAGGIASGLYEDYLDYMVSRGQRIRSRQSYIPNEPSTNSIVFPTSDATFIDSIGYYHNLILDDVKSNGKLYVTTGGEISYETYYIDFCNAAKKRGIMNNYSLNDSILFEYLESIIKPLALLGIECDEELTPDMIISILFNESYKKLGLDDTAQARDVTKTLIYNCINIQNGKIIEYGSKVNSLISESNINNETKDNLKIANNIAINSSLRHGEE